MSSRLIVCCALTLLVSGLSDDRGLAQQPAKAANEFVVIPLKHADAVSIVNVLQGAFGGQKQPAVRVVADPHTNAVLVSAQPADLTNIRELIARLDVPPRDSGESGKYTLKVFRLKYVKADKSIENSLKMAMSGTSNGRVSLDAARNQILVYADEPTQLAVEALLARLDERPVAVPVADVQVRVIWLVSGPLAEGAQAAPPPDDLQRLLPGLAKLGIDKPRLAAQSLITATPHTQFQSKGIAKLDGPVQFGVTGSYVGKPEAATLQIAIRASRTHGNTTEEVGNVHTEIAAPLGHFVILGMTPSESLTSIFVVQVVGLETKAPK